MASNITQTIGQIAPSVLPQQSAQLPTKDQTVQPTTQKDVARASEAAVRVASNSTKPSAQRSIQTSPTRVEAGFSGQQNKSVKKDHAESEATTEAPPKRPSRAVA